MSASYNMDRGGRKASEILASAYKAGRSVSQNRPGDFMHQSYNLGRPSSRHHDDFMTSSHNQDRSRRSTTNEGRTRAKQESSTKKDDFLTQFNADKSRKKRDVLSQSLNYEKLSQKKPSNSSESYSLRSSATAQPWPARRSSEFSRHDRPSTRGSDMMQRSHQSDRPPLGQSADFTSLTSAHGAFRKTLR